MRTYPPEVPLSRRARTGRQRELEFRVFAGVSETQLAALGLRQAAGQRQPNARAGGPRLSSLEGGRGIGKPVALVRHAHQHDLTMTVGADGHLAGTVAAGIVE